MLKKSTLILIFCTFFAISNHINTTSHNPYQDPKLITGKSRPRYAIESAFNFKNKLQNIVPKIAELKIINLKTLEEFRNNRHRLTPQPKEFSQKSTKTINRFLCQIQQQPKKRKRMGSENV